MESPSVVLFVTSHGTLPGARRGDRGGAFFLAMVLRMVYDTLASFTCPRTITFRDYRLGFTHKALVVAIAAYVCANLFMGQLYLVDSVPLGLVSMWSSPTYSGSLGDASFEDARDEFFRRYRKAGGEPYRYCDNPDYDYVFEFDKSFTYEDIECEFAESAQVAVKGESQMFFSTMIQQNSVAYVKKLQGGECDRAAFSAVGIGESECPSFAEVTESLGRCYCRGTANEFFVGVENMTLNLEHKYDALYGAGELPRTFVRVEGSTENLHEFEPGETFAMPLYKILEWLDLSLDGRAGGGGEQPMLRVKGVQIMAKLQYYNYHQAPGFEDQKDGTPGETVCILEFSPQDVWATLGSDVQYIAAQGSAEEKGGFVDRYRYGIKIVIEANGIISKVDFMFMMNAVIQGMVLLNVAVVLTQQVAFYLLGDRSKMYKEFGNETAIFEREAARFAVQSIVAGYVFQVIDTDKSGGLDQREVYDAIKERVKGSGLTDDELNTLAGFVIHQADLESEKHGEEDANKELGVIGLAEWDNLFASGFMDFHSLSRVVKNLSKEESSFLLHRAKTFKTGLGATYGAV